MEQRQHSKDIVVRLHRLAESLPPGELADALYLAVVEALRSGYSRDTLYEELSYMAATARKNGEEEKQDDIVDVSNVLVGYCAPSARI